MIAPASVPANAPAGPDTRPRGMDPARKRYTILRFDSNGRPELYSETCLASEIERFEDLGYVVEPQEPAIVGS